MRDKKKCLCSRMQLFIFVFSSVKSKIYWPIYLPRWKSCQVAAIYFTIILRYLLRYLRSRSRKDIVLWTRPKTNYIKDTFSYYGMNIWNNIPSNIRNVNNLKCFKEKYKAYLDVHMNE
jgi:hypothetical protein